MPRLLFVNRFFHPDHSATSQMLSDLAFHLAADGREVHVVTSRLSYEDPAARFPAFQVVQGVHVRRVASTRFGRAGLPGRALDYLSFYVSVFWCLLGTLRPGDIVVAKTDPPLLSVVVGVAAKIRRARLVNWLQDVFPEVGAALGVRILGGASGRALRHLRDLSLRGARANVVLGERMAQRVGECGVADARIAVIANWSDDAQIRPLEHPGNALRSRWGWGRRFVVVYSGNLGRAHEVKTFLDAAGMLRDDESIRFAFIGGGARMAQARAHVAAQRLNNVEFLPYQAREQLGLSLAAADLHLVSLLPALEGLIVPSKLYGIAAAGRPIAFVGDLQGEAASFVTQAGAGGVFEPGQGEALATFIRALAAAPERARQLGANARSYLEGRYTQAAAFAAWRALLDDIDKAV